LEKSNNELRVDVDTDKKVRGEARQLTESGETNSPPDRPSRGKDGKKFNHKDEAARVRDKHKDEPARGANRNRDKHKVEPVPGTGRGRYGVADRSENLTGQGAIIATSWGSLDGQH
jgi:hypothetical protein